MANETLTIDTVTRIATEVAREQSSPVRVVGTVLSSRGSQYAEIVVSIEGCHREPCQLQLGVFRNVDVQTLRIQIADQLLRHLASHDS